MMHDFATRNKAVIRHKTANTAKAKQPRKPLRVAVAAGVLTMVSVGALSFSHVVSAVSQDFHESIAEAKAIKDAERALKAQRAAEKQKLADEARVRRKVNEDKAQAERSAGYEFYEDLVGRPWPVPVESDAYVNNTSYAAPGAKEDTSIIPYSLQAALFREETEAISTQKSLAKLGYPGKVDSVKVKAGGTLFRVTLGPFTGLEKATHIRDQLQEHNYFAQVFRE